MVEADGGACLNLATAPRAIVQGLGDALGQRTSPRSFKVDFFCFSSFFWALYFAGIQLPHLLPRLIPQLKKNTNTHLPLPLPSPPSLSSGPVHEALSPATLLSSRTHPLLPLKSLKPTKAHHGLL